MPSASLPYDPRDSLRCSVAQLAPHCNANPKSPIMNTLANYSHLDLRVEMTYPWCCHYFAKLLQVGWRRRVMSLWAPRCHIREAQEYRMTRPVDDTILAKKTSEIKNVQAVTHWGSSRKALEIIIANKKPLGSRHPKINPRREKRVS